MTNYHVILSWFCIVGSAVPRFCLLILFSWIVLLGFLFCSLCCFLHSRQRNHAFDRTVTWIHAFLNDNCKTCCLCCDNFLMPLFFSYFARLNMLKCDSCFLFTALLAISLYVQFFFPVATKTSNVFK